MLEGQAKKRSSATKTKVPKRATSQRVIEIWRPVDLELLKPMVLVYSSELDKPAVKMIMLQVTQIVRFLLERGLRFRNLGVCGHDLI
jgi:hypothetical protein